MLGKKKLGNSGWMGRRGRLGGLSCLFCLPGLRCASTYPQMARVLGAGDVPGSGFLVRITAVPYKAPVSWKLQYGVLDVFEAGRLVAVCRRGCVDAWMRGCVDSVVTVGNVTSGGMMSSAFGWLVRRNSEFRVQYSSTYTSYKKRV